MLNLISEFGLIGLAIVAGHSYPAPQPIKPLPREIVFDLAKQGHGPTGTVASYMPVHATPKPQQHSLQVAAVGFAAESSYIVGPSWNIQPVRSGPNLELGALGGGNENAPYLAHVALDWKF